MKTKGQIRLFFEHVIIIITHSNYYTYCQRVIISTTPNSTFIFRISSPQDANELMILIKNATCLIYSNCLYMNPYHLDEQD